MTPLLTDLYELTMAAGYFEAGLAFETAAFELSFRSLPRDRGFVLAAGLPQVIEFLLESRFEAADIEYLRSLPQFARVSAGFFDLLQSFRFEGDVRAVPEGTPLFAGEPALTVRGPLWQAQIAETFLLATIGFQTLIATKAARVVEAAGARAVVEFGTRRAQSPAAGVLAGRAAFIGGCAGTSNTLAGRLYGIPVYGTAAHSWVQAFPTELEAQRRLQQLLGPSTIYLIDTYDTLEGARKAASLGRPLWGVRLDSGDFVHLSREVRRILDDAGLSDAKIMASSDLDEHRITELVERGAPIDAFGVGTRLATSADAPTISAVYKLVEIGSGGRKRYSAKFSEGKISYPGAKQIFRQQDRDVIACAGEQLPGEPLLEEVVRGGQPARPLPDTRAARSHAGRSVAALPAAIRRLKEPEHRRVDHSEELERLLEAARREAKGAPA